MTLNLKETREWATFICSIAVLPLIWMGNMALRNQRLEIDAAMQKQYVPREEYSVETKKLESQDTETWRKLGETNAKIDSLLIQAATMQQTLFDVKEEVQSHIKN